MKKAFVIVSGIISLFINRSLAQATDNAGKDLFTVKNTSKYSFPISSNGFSIDYTGPLNASDTQEIKKNKYDVLYKRDSSLVYIDLRQPGKYFRIRPHINGLATYYLSDSVQAHLTRLLATNPTALIKTLRYLHLDTAIRVENLPSVTLTIGSLHDTGYRQLLDTLNRYGLTDGFYNTTDVGVGYKPIFVNLKVSNLTLSSFSNFFTSSNQPSFQLEMGAIANSTIKFDNWQNLQRARRPGLFGKLLGFHQYDLFYSVFANSSCITYYDTVNHSRVPTNWQSIWQFAQYGAKANANLYYSKWFAIALTATVFRGLPLDNDKGFQSKPSRAVNTTDSTIYAAGKADGKYGGRISSPSWNARLSIAFPIFLNFLPRANPGKKGIGSVYLLPSYVPYGTFNTHWTHQVGLSANLLAKPYGGINSSIVPAGGVGIDFVSDPKKRTGWGPAILYISGTININSIISQKGTLSKR